jgi:hypothetical protein
MVFFCATIIGEREEAMFRYSAGCSSPYAHNNVDTLQARSGRKGWQADDFHVPSVDIF